MEQEAIFAWYYWLQSAQITEKFNFRIQIASWKLDIPRSKSMEPDNVLAYIGHYDKVQNPTSPSTLPEK